MTQPSSNQSLGHPSSTELIKGVNQFLLNEIAPQLSGHSAFHLKVACNVLNIVIREMIQGDNFQKDNLELLTPLFSDNDDKTLSERYQQICIDIRENSLDAESSELLATLKQLTLSQLAIDNPKYSGLKQANDEQ